MRNVLNSLAEQQGAVHAYKKVVELAPSHLGARVSLSALQQQIQLQRYNMSLTMLNLRLMFTLRYRLPGAEQVPGQAPSQRTPKSRSAAILENLKRLQSPQVGGSQSGASPVSSVMRASPGCSLRQKMDSPGIGRGQGRSSPGSLLYHPKRSPGLASEPNTLRESTDSYSSFIYTHSESLGVSVL